MRSEILLTNLDGLPEIFIAAAFALMKKPVKCIGNISSSLRGSGFD